MSFCFSLQLWSLYGWSLLPDMYSWKDMLRKWSRTSISWSDKTYWVSSKTANGTEVWWMRKMRKRQLFAPCLFKLYCSVFSIFCSNALVLGLILFVGCSFYRGLEFHRASEIGFDFKEDRKFKWFSSKSIVYKLIWRCYDQVSERKITKACKEVPCRTGCAYWV